MPEGDTIFRAARTLARALTGRTVDIGRRRTGAGSSSQYGVPTEAMLLGGLALLEHAAVEALDLVDDHVRSALAALEAPGGQH